MSIVCRYIDNEFDLMRFHRHLQQIEGIKYVAYEDLCKERAFAVFENNEIVGGWVEQVYPFERCLANLPLEARSQILGSCGISYWNSIFMGSYHLDRKKASWRASIALAWHSLSAAGYSKRANVVFASYEPRLFDKWETSGAITIDERPSRLLPDKLERVMYYSSDKRTLNFLKGAAWIIKRAIFTKRYRKTEPISESQNMKQAS